MTRRGEQEKLPTETVVTADGHVRILEKFNLAQFLKLEDLFVFGMVPQLISRFDQLVLLDDLSTGVLERILLEALDSPFVRSREYFASRGIRLEITDRAGRLIAERAARPRRRRDAASSDGDGRPVRRSECAPTSDGSGP